jgi:hypothetical protein
MHSSISLGGVGRATAFAGSARQASILGKLYVLGGYAYILALLNHVVTFAAGLIVLPIRDNCSGRHGTAVQSLLFGSGQSPICGDGAAGQILALLVPILELALVLLIIRGPSPADGRPLSPAIETKVRSVFTPLVPLFARLQLWEWQERPRITPGGILFSPAIVKEFTAWESGAAINPLRPATHYAIFATLHEVGHLALHDLLYNRGADRAVPVVSTFVGLLLFVAAPAGAFVESFWLKATLTGLECFAAAVATRFVLRCILTDLEFLMDNFAASLVTGFAGRRLSMPPFLQEDRKRWIERSHPALAVRREYLRSMRCDAFLWTWLVALPLMVLVGVVSTPSRNTMASIHILSVGNDLLALASLFALGVFGGAAAADRAFRGAWSCYGVVWLLAIAVLTFYWSPGMPPILANDVHQLAFQGRSGFWVLVLFSPLAGVAARQWTDWFSASPTGGPDPPPVAARSPTRTASATPVAWSNALSPRWLLHGGRAALHLLARWFYRGFVTFAAAEAATFGFVLLYYVLDTGILSWIDMVVFTLCLAIPLSHALRPSWWPPLVLDLLFQTFFLSMMVFIIVALSFVTDLSVIADNAEARARLLANPDMILGPMLDGTLFQARGETMLQQMLWLWGLMLAIGSLRLGGQVLERQQRQRNANEQA